MTELSPQLEALGLRPLTAADAPELQAVDAFDEWNLHRIEIHCAPANHRSRAIPERLGFREEATLRETELVGGRYLDSVVYGLLEGESSSRWALSSM